MSEAAMEPGHRIGAVGQNVVEPVGAERLPEFFTLTAAQRWISRALGSRRRMARHLGHEAMVGRSHWHMKIPRIEWVAVLPRQLQRSGILPTATSEPPPRPLLWRTMIR